MKGDASNVSGCKAAGWKLIIATDTFVDVQHSFKKYCGLSLYPNSLHKRNLLDQVVISKPCSIVITKKSSNICDGKFLCTDESV